MDRLRHWLEMRARLQTASPLQNQINGSHFGYHQVEIQVQALLNHLGCHQHRPVGPLYFLEIPFLSLDLATWLAETPECPQFPLFPAIKKIPGMKQVEFWPAIACIQPWEEGF
jgi:hypothetical protein